MRRARPSLHGTSALTKSKLRSHGPLSIKTPISEKVRSAVLTIVRPLPVYPQLRTSHSTTLTVAKGHFQTHASQQSKPYSITSSARASTDAGRSRPSALAVFRLTTSSYLVGVCTGRSAGFAPALISAIMGHAGAAPTSASSSSKARTKLPGGPRRGLGLSQIGRQMPALLSFTFLDLKCGSASSRAVPPV
jgi:hypothetical protein